MCKKMNEKERKKEVEKLLQDPKIRKSVERLYKTFGKIKGLEGVGFSVVNPDGQKIQQSYITKEQIDSVNKNTKRGKTKWNKYRKSLV